MNLSDYLSKEEIASFSARSDLHAWRLVLGNWLAIAAIFYVAGAFPNPITILGAVVLLGGRQLGLSVLMHECGHRTFFRTTWLNDFVGQWLCALPVLNDMPSYARGHLAHHRLAGTADDPDLSNYRYYPVSKASFRRKVIRDLTGQTGFKLVSFIVRGVGGVMTRERRSKSTPFLCQVLVQVILFTVLASFGIAWVYLLWAAAYMTVFMLIIRIRQVAEHAAVPDLFDPDPRRNTRTVRAPWWQRLVFAPNGVNFHMEHHMLAGVPCYRLEALHKRLIERHALDNTPVFTGYGQVLRHAVA